jgi:hypothetical protein
MSTLHVEHAGRLLGGREPVEPTPEFVEAAYLSGDRMIIDELGFKKLLDELVDRSSGVPR